MALRRTTDKVPLDKRERIQELEAELNAFAVILDTHRRATYALEQLIKLGQNGEKMSVLLLVAIAAKAIDTLNNIADRRPDSYNPSLVTHLMP